MDFGRLIIFLFICIIGQRAIGFGVSYLCLLLRIDNPFVIMILVDVAIGFFFAYLYRSRDARRGCFKDPTFYRDAGIFALIFIVMDMVL